jgi:hypothetical protein
VNGKKEPDGREVYRSPGATVVWWVWVLFAIGNLVDIAVQGHGHLSLVAVFILLFVTGMVYVAAKRPRLVADDDGLTITNPFRGHRVGWAAVAGADPTDLLRIQCEWPAGDGTRRQAFYSWAVHSSRRRRYLAEMRARSQALRDSRGAGAFGPGGGGGGLFTVSSLGFGGTFSGGAAGPAPENDPLRLDADKVAAEITWRAEQARLAAPEAQAAPPVSAWDWRAVAAFVVPGLALLIVALA